MKAGLRVIPFAGIVSLLLMLGIGSTSGKIVVDVKTILDYLFEYFNKLEKLDGISASPAEQNQILERYTGDQRNTQDRTIKQIEIAKVLISVQKDAATLQYDQPCNLADQDFFNELYSPADVRWHDVTFKETYEHFVKLDNAGKKFCNVFAYLRCQHDKMNPSKPHRCRCPARMTWQDNKCVFSEGEKCDRISEGLQAKDKIFAVYDFKAGDFTRRIPPNCERGTKCQNGNRESKKCERDGDFDYLATPFDLSAYLRRHINDFHKRNKIIDTYDRLTYEALRSVLHGITLNSKRSFLLALSLEMKTEDRLLDHGGGPCDPTLEATSFEPLLRKYNSYENPGWKANENSIEQDKLRYKYLQRVLQLDAKVCNPFKLLYCTSSKSCACKDGFSYDPDKKYCVNGHSYRCGESSAKIFEVNLKYDFDFEQDALGAVILDDDEDDYDIFQNIRVFYYKLTGRNECQAGTSCNDLDNFGQFCTVLKDQVDMENLQLEFEKKFSLEVNAGCAITAQDDLFQEVNKFDWKTSKTFNDAKAVIDALIKKPTSYCRIRRHSACSRDSGKCICIEPSVSSTNSAMGTTTCVLPYNWKCDYLHRSKMHEALDKINLPINIAKRLEIEIANKLSCTSLSDCIDPFRIGESFCSCPEDHLYGAKCDKYLSNHLAHLSIIYLPASMRSAEGIRIISELHDPITQLDARMTLSYGNKCDSKTNQEFADIMEFLAVVRDSCDCFYTDSKGWSCSTENCYTTSEPEFQKPRFQSMLQDSKTLASKSPILCNWNRAERCVDGACGCPNEFIHENGNCRVDLGGRCYKWTSDNDHTRTCRSGLRCSSSDSGSSSKPFKTYCEHMSTGLNWNHCTGCQTQKPEVYVSHVRSELIRRLSAGTQELKKVRTYSRGKPCSHETENELKNALNQVDLVLKMVDPPGGGIQNERQHVRYLMKYLDFETQLKNKKFCKENLVCSKNNKCDNRNGGVDEDSKKPKPDGGSFAPTQFRPINFLILNLLTFVRVQLLQ